MAKILIADNSPMIRASIKRFFVESGHEVVGLASTNNETVAKFQDRKPDLVVLDIILMPEMSGIPALKAILAADSRAVVIMLTVSISGREAEALRLGAAGTVKKPISKAALVTEVERVLPRAA